jgi:amino acid efflux transporter
MAASTHGPISHVQLRRTIELRHAVALYISSVLGSGILVLPGLAAKIAGPASLVAWLVLSLASFPFAYTFATLSSRRPESGGVYGFARESFGPLAATLVGWLFGLWFVSGAPAVTLIAASYISYAFPMSTGESYVIAAGVIFVGFVVNYRGITFSNRVQVAIVIAIVGLLVAAVVFSASAVRWRNFFPFAPHGWPPVGTAMALIFWSFLGYENVSNIAEEFHDPQRDFRRSIVLSVLVIGVLYVAVAIVTVGTGADRAGGSVAPFAAIFGHVLGDFGAGGTAILALFIILGAVNAYTAGMSRVMYAVARDGGFPRSLAHVSPKTGVPDRSLVTLFGFAMVMLAIYFIARVDLETALLIPSGAALLVYVIGSAAGVKLLERKGGGKMFAGLSLAMSLAILPFVGFPALCSMLTLLAGLGFALAMRRKKRAGRG